MKFLILFSFRHPFSPLKKQVFLSTFSNARRRKKGIWFVCLRIEYSLLGSSRSVQAMAFREVRLYWVLQDGECRTCGMQALDCKLPINYYHQQAEYRRLLWARQVNHNSLVSSSKTSTSTSLQRIWSEWAHSMSDEPFTDTNRLLVSQRDCSWRTSLGMRLGMGDNKTSQAKPRQHTQRNATIKGLGRGAESKRNEN